MRPSDQLFEQSIAPVSRTGTDTSVDETVAQFLATSALYFRLPAEQPETLRQHTNFHPEIEEPS